ncbi:MAG: hypothetical protein NTY38_17605 [Acidobacteria bacterium]|nr:hypothetical protein [Acidobacteriota bacterium]
MHIDFDYVATTCPSMRDEMAERYCMKWLPVRETEAFSRHLESCYDCRKAVREFEEFLKSLLAALRDAA